MPAVWAPGHVDGWACADRSRAASRATSATRELGSGRASSWTPGRSSHGTTPAPLGPRRDRKRDRYRPIKTGTPRAGARGQHDHRRVCRRNRGASRVRGVTVVQMPKLGTPIPSTTGNATLSQATVQVDPAEQDLAVLGHDSLSGTLPLSIAPTTVPPAAWHPADADTASRTRSPTLQGASDVCQRTARSMARF